MDTATTFRARVDQLDARLRELLPAIAGEIRCERGDGSVRWSYRDRWGTLALHETDQPPRLSLLLYRESVADEQDAVEVAIDEDGVIDVLAEPLSGLFTGQLP